MNNITLNWKLIPSWEALDDKQNKEFIEKKGGIYLKIWKPTNEIIYVGETTCFIDRLRTHLFHHLSGGYTTCDYQQMETENIKSIYDFWKKYMFGKTPEAFIEAGGHYPLDNFTSRIRENNLTMNRHFTRNISLALAELPAELLDKRKQIESYLQMIIWKKTSLILGYKDSEFESECKIKVKRGSSPFGKVEHSNILKQCSFKIIHNGSFEIEKQFSLT